MVSWVHIRAANIFHVIFSSAWEMLSTSCLCSGRIFGRIFRRSSAWKHPSADSQARTLHAKRPSLPRTPWHFIPSFPRSPRRPDTLYKALLTSTDARTLYTKRSSLPPNKPHLLNKCQINMGFSHFHGIWNKHICSI